MSESPEFDRFATDYKNLVKDPVRDRFARDATFFAKRKWILLKEFYSRKNRPMAGNAWLDVGCGEGDLLRYGRGSFAKVAGCDFSAKMIEAAQDLDDVRVQTDPTRLPFDDAQFDLATAVCVFHHVAPPYRPKLILEMKRILKPGGLLCLIEHNAQNPVVRGIVRRVPVDENAILLKQQECRDLMQQAGIQFLETEFFLYLPQPIYNVCGPLEALGRRVPLGGQYAAFGVK
jgi:ubiquinone/menaquinone biosynthesis C-methylase UbiE